ncbi:unnamed protein product [Allacma fusca]|uniref:Fe2OG dioxygenase domain-containing protein n=1 Tax=Allacma fusca TaxID=39272 RepID=A0A8J2LDB1_9HEXA|nr:unnamed protein product [Allacma fusca]
MFCRLKAKLSTYLQTKSHPIDQEDPEIQEIANKFGLALHENNGCAYLTNHGIPEEMVSAAFAESQTFFELPAAIKMKYCKEDLVKNYHGYSAVGQERLNDEKNRELKETFDICGRDRFYPEEVPMFKEATESLEAACWKFQAKLFKLLAMSIKLENVNVINDGARNCIDRTIPSLNTARTAYYPPIRDDAIAGDIRCAPHTDYGLLTLLFQDDIGGLEVQGSNTEWLPVTPIPGTIVVNSGDLLEKWTCGYFVATPHRVIIPEAEIKMKKCRQTFMSFSITDNDIYISPLKSELLDKDYYFEPVNSFDHAMGKAKKAYGEDEIKVRERIEFSKAELKFHAFIDYREYTEEYFDKKRPVTHLGTAGFQLCF